MLIVYSRRIKQRYFAVLIMYNNVYVNDVILKSVYLQKNHFESKLRGLTLILSRGK